MRFFLFLILLLPIEAFAQAPECPLYGNREECIKSVEENYRRFLEFIEQEYEEGDQPVLIEAATDIKKFEGLACQRTCYN